MLEVPFWERLSLAQMDQTQWESLCDGCGRCCLHKIQDEDTDEVLLTSVSCHLLDTETCRCTSYEDRAQLVPRCIVLKPDQSEEVYSWLPTSCAYRRLHEGRGLADWHPLVSGAPESVVEAGISVRGLAVSETLVSEDDWDNLIERLTQA